MPRHAYAGPIYGYLLARDGRHRTLFYSAVGFAFSYAALASAHNLWSVLAGRFLCGVCAGAVAVAVPLYVAETAAPRHRGLLGMAGPQMGTLGILYVQAGGFNKVYCTYFMSEK